MAAMMDQHLGYAEDPLDPDDIAFPCKGCGEILEEGKAFELAGNRWHIDCFRCNTCGTLLDSDANLLLLGDGSLICNNCTYSCSSCGDKIEDLAILTGDQAFCANCFKCRNCKRKIENLRYARTSQGIFCMDCHEALMARRRKKTSRNTTSRTKLSANNLDKSLPAIPPPEARITAYMPDSEPAYSMAFDSSMSDGPSMSRVMNELRDVDSRPSTGEQSQSRDALTLPQTSFRDERQSYMSQRSDMSGGEEYLIPLAFDPTAPVQSPNQTQPRHNQTEDKSRDYLNKSVTSPTLSSTSQSKTASPHIAYQEKGRQPSNQMVDHIRNRRDESASRSTSAGASPFTPTDSSRSQTTDASIVSQSTRGDTALENKFKLQDAPKTKRLGLSNRSSASDASTARAETSTEYSKHLSSPVAAPIHELDSGEDTSTYQNIERLIPMHELEGTIPHHELDASENLSTAPRRSHEDSPSSATTQESPRAPFRPSTSLLANLPKRGDSLDSQKRKQTIPRKELNSSATIPQSPDMSNTSTPNIKSATVPTDLLKTNAAKNMPGSIESTQATSVSNTPNQIDSVTSGKHSNQAFVSPRAPPLPPTASGRRNDSISKIDEDAPKSPSLPQYGTLGDFTMDEDMARILGNDGTPQHGSFLRRVSNSVRHGRSHSDKAGRLSRDRWPRSPVVSLSAGQEISSPTTASPEHRDELTWFKNELRRERQKAIDREKRITELETQLDASANIKQANTELREKRSTMVVLDAQKEIVVRELEVLTEHIASAKNNGEPLDVHKMSNAALRDFAASLEKLKNSFAPQIEESIQMRNDLINEIANLTQMKDKSFLEFEQLSSKNAQLAELNNQLVLQIQELYKANSGPTPEPVKNSINGLGLGIYSHHKEKSTVSIDSRELRNLASEPSIADSGTTLQASEAEPITVLQGPQVVNIRKGQPKKFDWRKGQKVAKGVTKGLKGAFSSTQQSYNRDMQFAETGAYGGGPSGQENASLSKSQQDSIKQGSFGFFSGNQKGPMQKNGLYATQNTSNHSMVDPSTVLYGADLEQRAEFEKVAIPIIVRRCIEEVESRGMDVEGIYRKSGGNSQVQQVREGFERSPNDCNISDPELEIHAVTSGLKQYFRRLPTPLITYEVYDRLLETTSIQNKEERIDATQTALEGLPKVHYETLEFLMRHLVRVVQQEQENLMTSMNVAVVFAPTIMRPESLAREMSDTKMKNEAVMWMVEQCDKIF